VPRQPLGIKVEGPFFTADIGKTLAENAGDFTAKLAAHGEAEAKRRTWGAPRKTAGPSLSASFIRGRTRALPSRGGRAWAMTTVISATGGIEEQHASKATAIRVQATLAGRHNPIDRDGHNIGTTPGHEGTAGVFRRTAASLRRLVKNLDLTKGLGG
jgi:hypothetical protein